MQVAARLGRDLETERDWPLDERLGAPGEDLEGDPSLPVTLLDGSYEARLIEDLGTSGVHGEVIGEVGVMLVQSGVQRC